MFIRLITYIIYFTNSNCEVVCAITVADPPPVTKFPTGSKTGIYPLNTNITLGKQHNDEFSLSLSSSLSSLLRLRLCLKNTPCTGTNALFSSMLEVRKKGLCYGNVR